jgi:hypothetical protein
MRPVRTLVLGLIAASAIAVPAAAQRPEAPGVPSGTIVIRDGGVDVTVACRTGRRNVKVLGAGAQVRVNGRCKLISVSGAGAIIRANVVDRIRVSGAYARVSYRASSSGGAASVRVSGVGAKVTRRG